MAVAFKHRTLSYMRWALLHGYTRLRYLKAWVFDPMISKNGLGFQEFQMGRGPLDDLVETTVPENGNRIYDVLERKGLKNTGRCRHDHEITGVINISCGAVASFLRTSWTSLLLQNTHLRRCMEVAESLLPPRKRRIGSSIMEFACVILGKAVRDSRHGFQALANLY